MPDREKVIADIEEQIAWIRDNDFHKFPGWGHAVLAMKDALAILKEQEKKQITLHKKHVITWRRNDEFSMRKLYEAICETLLDEGELFIARTDDHEKVDFVFYVAEGSVK
jgi:hypothetical protein